VLYYSGAGGGGAGNFSYSVENDPIGRPYALTSPLALAITRDGGRAAVITAGNALVNASLHFSQDSGRTFSEAADRRALPYVGVAMSEDGVRVAAAVRAARSAPPTTASARPGGIALASGSGRASRPLATAPCSPPPSRAASCTCLPAAARCGARPTREAVCGVYSALGPKHYLVGVLVWGVFFVAYEGCALPLVAAASARRLSFIEKLPQAGRPAATTYILTHPYLCSVRIWPITRRRAARVCLIISMDAS
jgi:hypothetical protein